MYEVHLSRRANRYYQRVDIDTARRLDRCLDQSSRNPFSTGNVRLIRGRRGPFRYRVGEIRVLFTVSQHERIVRVNLNRTAW